MPVFVHSIGTGMFVSTGVTTESNSTVNGATSVHCLSTHTTSFAVLVDVGGLQVYLLSYLPLNNVCMLLGQPVCPPKRNCPNSYAAIRNNCLTT